MVKNMIIIMATWIVCIFVISIMLAGCGYPTQGSQGIQGDTGAVGAIGSQGQAGVTGSQGMAGSPGADGNGFTPGLQCGVYSIIQADTTGTVNWDKLFSDATLQFTTILANFNIPNEVDTVPFATFTTAQQALIGDTYYALDCSGFITIPETGEYTFTQGSDDGSALVIDDNLLINMPVAQPFSSTSVTVSLYSGQHRINVLYFQSLPTNVGLQLFWQGPNNIGLGSITLVPSSALMH
jgi:hypothetical protein